MKLKNFFFLLKFMYFEFSDFISQTHLILITIIQIIMNLIKIYYILSLFRTNTISLILVEILLLLLLLLNRTWSNHIIWSITILALRVSMCNDSIASVKVHLILWKVLLLLILLIIYWHHHILLSILRILVIIIHILLVLAFNHL
jgi:hypothetical protein